MEEWLLTRCSENLYFAHALEFELRANCLPAARFLSSGASATPSAAESVAALGRGDANEGGRRLSESRSGSGGGARSGDVDSGSESGGVIDRGGRRAVELLLLEIAEKGEHAARRLASVGRISDAGGIVGKLQGELDDAGGVPLGATFTAGVSTGESKVSGRDELSLGAGISPYRQTLHFLASLAEIAASLFPLPKTERTNSLRAKLEQVGKECLSAEVVTGYGSTGVSDRRGGELPLVYVPVGDRRHRVVAVHPAESFAFSTRERAPCFICLEVISSAEPPVAEDADYLGDGERVGMWQWLPSSLRSPRSMRFHRTFKLPGGREWKLSLGADDEAECVTAGDSGGEGKGGGGVNDVDTEAGSLGRGDASYRLLFNEGAGESNRGRGARAGRPEPLSDAREWWAADSVSGGGGQGSGAGGRGDGGGGYDDGREAVAAVFSSENSLRERWLPPPSPEARAGGSAGVDAVQAMEAGGVVGTSGSPSAAVAGEPAGPPGQRCPDCGADGGGRCRPGCPSERSRRPQLVPATEGAKAEGGAEGERKALPQVLFNELWQDKTDRIRRCLCGWLRSVDHREVVVETLRWDVCMVARRKSHSEGTDERYAFPVCTSFSIGVISTSVFAIPMH